MALSKKKQDKGKRSRYNSDSYRQKSLQTNTDEGMH